PEAVAPDLVGKVFEDGEAVPDHRIAVPQHRDLAGRWLEIAVLALDRFPFLAGDIDRQLIESKAGLLGREPAAQRPARIVPVADDQLHRGSLALAPVPRDLSVHG